MAIGFGVLGNVAIAEMLISAVREREGYPVAEVRVSILTLQLVIGCSRRKGHSHGPCMSFHNVMADSAVRSNKFYLGHKSIIMIKLLYLHVPYIQPLIPPSHLCFHDLG